LFVCLFVCSLIRLFLDHRHAFELQQSTQRLREMGNTTAGYFIPKRRPRVTEKRFSNK
jgi:hypothetical protein